MPESYVFRLGADVRCADGDCGLIKSLVISPADDAVTHLVVEPAHRQGLGKLVPLRLVDTTYSPAPGGEVRLLCPVAEYGQLQAAEATYFFAGDEDYPTYRKEPMVAWPYYAPPGATGLPDVPGDDPREISQVVTVDTVPDQLPGTDEVSRGQHVHAIDGDIGHVQGITVDPGTGHVTSVLLRERHLLSHRTVLIPRSAVAEVSADGFHLSITKRQAQDLPPADIDHPAGQELPRTDHAARASLGHKPADSPAQDLSTLGQRNIPVPENRARARRTSCGPMASTGQQCDSSHGWRCDDPGPCRGRHADTARHAGLGAEPGG